MNTSLLLIIFFVIYLLMVWKSGKVYPILYLFIFTYFVQYLFSAYLIYYEYDELKSQMPISPERYFDYALPAVMALFLGTLLFNKDIDISSVFSKIDKDQASKLGYSLLFISYGFDFLVLMGVPGIGSLHSFTRDLKFLAAFCFLFVGSGIGYVIIIMVYIHLAYNVVQAGVFINFFIWASYFYFFATLKFRAPFWLRASFIVIAVPLLVLIQSIKDQYRELAWNGKRSSGIELFSELAGQEVGRESDIPFTQSSGVISTIGRLTEGWHVGLTIRHVPSREPFSDGEEFISDVISSFLPRAIFSDKKVVGTQDKFYQYTGHKLAGGTAMSIGILGDFYINFGTTGGVIALFILGAAIAWFLHYFIIKYVLPVPINIIWIPFILNYLVRAGNDFYMFFNGTVKGFVIFLIINYFFKRSLKKKNISRFNGATIGEHFSPSNSK